MKKLLSLFLLTLSLAGCKTSGDTTKSSSIETKIDSVFSSISDFSGVVLFADKGKVIFQKAFGVRNYETNVPTQPDDIFELASVSKQFTAMAIIMLKEQGLLTYDDLIETYLPTLHYQGITIRQLLTHTSGLPDYQAVMDQYWDKARVATNADIMEYLNEYKPPMQFEPGKKYEYSNTGYVLLASIVEAVSGQDFVAFCDERIFTPLQMSSTAIRSNEEKASLPNLALGHVYVPEKSRYIRADSFPSSNYTIWLGGRKGPGRVSSTASDLLKWDQALYSDKLVTKASLTEVFTPQPLTDGSTSQYGFGWMLIPTSPAGKVVWHNGDNPGYKTIIVRYLDDQKTLIMLSNNYHEKFEEIRETIDALVAESKNE